MDKDDAKKFSEEDISSFFKRHRGFFGDMTGYCGMNGWGNCMSMFRDFTENDRNKTDGAGTTAKKRTRRHGTGRFMAGLFGLLIISVGIAWLGESLGILPAGFEPLRYAIPAFMVVAGAWIITAQILKGLSKRER